MFTNVSTFLVAMLVLALIGPAALVSAQTANGYQCGRVTAYTAPTATSAGSIKIGSSTFQLAAGATAERQISVGQDVCFGLQGDRNASGAFTRFTVQPMAEGVCGTASSYVAATATQSGRVTLTSADGAFLFGIAAGTTLAASQVTGDHCYRTGVRADTGDAEINGYIGPRNAPSPSQLPNTSTAAEPSLWAAGIAAVVLAVSLFGLARLRRAVREGRVM